MSVEAAAWKACVFGFCLLSFLAACAVTGAGYDDYGGVSVGYVGGFYEPYGYDYGGWGGRYHVGPPRGGDRHEREDRHGGADHARGGHEGGRAPPSIPHRSRKH